MANTIITEIELDLDKLKASLKEAESAGEKSGSSVGKKFGDNLESNASKSFASLGIGFSKLAAIAATVGFGALFKHGIDEAIQQENAINQLNNALIRTGQINATDSVQAFATSLEALTGVEDAVIMKGQALLVNLAKLSGDGLNKATEAALNLAAVTGVSTETAFELMAKAANGNAEVLHRYGITVKSSKDNTEEFNNALQALSRFQGEAANKTNTFQGAVGFLSLGFNKVLQSIGEVVVKSPALIAVIKTIAQDLLKLAQLITATFEGRDVVGNFLNILIDLGLTVNKWVVVPFELAFNFIKTGFLTISTAATAFLGLFSDQYKQMSEQLAASTVASANAAFDFDVAATNERYLAKLQEVVAVTGPATADAVNTSLQPTKEVILSTWDQIAIGVKDKLKEMADFTKGFVNQVGTAFQTFSAGIGKGFAQVGSNLVNGQSAFKNFGKIMLGVLGDIAIQFGTFFIMVGLGRAFLGDPTGLGLVAIGVGLSVLGGVLKALSGGQEGVGGSAAAAGASGAGGSGGGGGVEAGNFKEQDRNTEPKTSIAVNVQGNVLDRRETGLELVTVLTEAFGTNGLSVTGNA